MTPAINLLKKKKVFHTIHEYTHEASCEAYGLEAAEKLGVDAARVYKTLVVRLDSGQLVVGIIPVSEMLNMKQLAKAAGAKKAAMADAQEVERVTGYVLGGVSPLGQKKSLQTFMEASAADASTIFVSAGRRGLDVELRPLDLQSLTRAHFAPLVGRM